MKTISFAKTAGIGVIARRSLACAKTIGFVPFALATVTFASACNTDESCVDTATCSPNTADSGANAESGNDASPDHAKPGSDATIDLRSDADKDVNSPIDAKSSDEARVDAITDSAARDTAEPDRTVSIDVVSADSFSDRGGSNGSEPAPEGGGEVMDSQVRDVASDDVSDASGEVDVGPTCTPSTCPTGCCDANDKCVTTTSPAACGSGGMKCQACSAGQECNGSTCACSPTSCTAGCCSGTECKPFAQQSDMACGAAQACGMCTSTQRCNKTNGQCECNATSCPTGCCNGAACYAYSNQNDQVCGTGGAMCAGCSSDKYCDAVGVCETKTWCQTQTIPSDVNLADYQCVDFDTGSLPAAWTLNQTGSGAGVISKDQASSAPNSFHSTIAYNIDSSSGTVTWSRLGSASVQSVDLAVDLFRVQSGGDPGPWTGYNELACAAFGSARACLYYQGDAGFHLSYWDGSNRVDCGRLTELPMGSWSHLELQLLVQGTISLTLNGVVTTCKDGGSAFPTSQTGSFAVGIGRTGMTLTSEMYFDDVVAMVRR